MDEKLKLIEKYLKKKKEHKIINLIIRNYEQSNFYMALVYNEKINKYKVLFIPMDVIDTEYLEDYVCYQFMNVRMADYVIDTIRDFEYMYLEKDFRERKNPNMENYYIEVNLYKEKKEYKFNATKYFPKDWLFMYELIVLLFEHAPHIVNELCVDLLSILNNNQVVEYQLSYDIDIYNDDLSKIFNEDAIKEGKEFYNNKQVKFLEKVNGKYFAIVKDHIVIIEFNNSKKILNVYCNCDLVSHKSHIYAVILNIINEKFRSFYKVRFDDYNGKSSYYLCYGIDGDNLKVIHGQEEKLLHMELFKEGRLKILEDSTGYLEKSCLTKLEKLYSSDEVKEIKKNMRDNLPK